MILSRSLDKGNAGSGNDISLTLNNRLMRSFKVRIASANFSTSKSSQMHCVALEPFYWKVTFLFACNNQLEKCSIGQFNRQAFVHLGLDAYVGFHEQKLFVTALWLMRLWWVLSSKACLFVLFSYAGT